MVSALVRPTTACSDVGSMLASMWAAASATARTCTATSCVWVPDEAPETMRVRWPAPACCGVRRTGTSACWPGSTDTASEDMSQATGASPCMVRRKRSGAEPVLRTVTVSTPCWPSSSCTGSGAAETLSAACPEAPEPESGELEAPSALELDELALGLSLAVSGLEDESLVDGLGPDE